MKIEKPTVELINHYPDNSDFKSVLIKLVALNDFYKTNVYEIFEVAQHYLTCNIDERLKKNDYQLVNTLANYDSNQRCEYGMMDAI